MDLFDNILIVFYVDKEKHPPPSFIRFFLDTSLHKKHHYLAVCNRGSCLHLSYGH